MFYYNDIFLIIGLLISIIATIGVNVSYSKYKKILNSKGLTGFDVARNILDSNGLSNILVLETRGNLTDHYDPTRKVVKLSTDIYHGKSLAAIAVAAHECGHAIQDKDNYVFLRFRSMIFPIVNLSSKLGYFVILIGILFSNNNLLWLGILLELIILLFQLVTLPVEFNASNRALKIILEKGMVTSSEHEGTKRMLTSAAMTYVASVLTNILDIIRLILIARDGDN